GGRNRVRQLRMLGRALGDNFGLYDDEAIAMSRARELLYDLSVLVVVDNVWTAEQLRTFMIVGPRSGLLFVTRDAELALAVGAHITHLEPFEGPQARMFLRKWLSRDDPNLDSIADILGGLPLALKIAAASLREGETGLRWLDRFRRAAAV